MAISKIILNGITQIDLTQDTVSQAGHILAPYIGHLNNGVQVTGTGTGSASVTEVENEYGTEVIIITGQAPTPEPEPEPTPTPSGDWETVFDSTITSTLHTESGKYVSRIEELQDLWFSSNEIWRVTYDGVQYICSVGTTNGVPSVGNSSLIDTDNGVNEPFLMYNVGGGEMICLTRTIGEHTLKLEQSV